MWSAGCHQQRQQAQASLKTEMQQISFQRARPHGTPVLPLLQPFHRFLLLCHQTRSPPRRPTLPLLFKAPLSQPSRAQGGPPHSHMRCHRLQQAALTSSPSSGCNQPQQQMLFSSAFRSQKQAAASKPFCHQQASQHLPLLLRPSILMMPATQM